MFRKLSNRMSSLFGNDKVTSLVNMGFDATQASNALEATDGNVERAAELLLVASNNHSNLNESSIANANANSNSNVNTNRSTSQHNDYEQSMETAMRESLASEDARLQRQTQRETNTVNANVNTKNLTKKKKKSNSPLRSKRTPAALAAEARANRISPKSSNSNSNSKSKSNTKYKMPTPLQQTSKEDLIPRLVARLSPYPRAVDTLKKALTALKQDPSNAKYRTIDKNTPGYQATLQKVPSAEDLLLALHFYKRPRGQYGMLVIERPQVDIALLWIALSSLDAASQTNEYKIAKQKVHFENSVRSLLSLPETQVSEEEITQRLHHSKQLCTEPRNLGSNTIQIQLLPETIVKRRFDGDDQLRDILHWMGSLHSTLAQHLQDGIWCLVDQNISPPMVIPCDERSLNLTLQRIGCWPSGKLELRKGGGGKEEIMGFEELQQKTRGLGVSASAESNIIL